MAPHEGNLSDREQTHPCPVCCPSPPHHNKSSAISTRRLRDLCTAMCVSYYKLLKDRFISLNQWVDPQDRNGDRHLKTRGNCVNQLISLFLDVSLNFQKIRRRPTFLKTLWCPSGLTARELPNWPSGRPSLAYKSFNCERTLFCFRNEVPRNGSYITNSAFYEMHHKALLHYTHTEPRQHEVNITWAGIDGPHIYPMSSSLTVGFCSLRIYHSSLFRRLSKFQFGISGRFGIPVS
ncbi:hypothetical protein CDAR_14091 [Caerostris darwini]|uniref:Uncharacterized protein n=1 Tax=Caerostris darwini TaxID=1538125 RepID=A0AAV4N5Z1_9ARAC|nr:hypothetical protein CDAR_14091 [Caerostris darwini]